ncbi:PorT family protein [Bacteroidales bacterium OttesenSCG-928-M06]|nr:PorT family protein [Bacteroidales bacterium OttesenSCG-928-M06]
MKKNFLFIIGVLLLSSLTAQAQFKYGLKAGVNIANASLSKDVINKSNMTGFQVGPIIEFTVPVLGIGLDAAALYSQQGFKVKDIDEKTYRTHTLDVPVNLKYKFNLVVMGAYLTAGPYASFNLSDNLKDQYKSKSFGAGLNFGLGIELLSHLQVGASYKLGLTDDYSGLTVKNGISEAFKGKQRGWTISAAYFF